MKFQFKKQAFQTQAVRAVVDCFVGQTRVDSRRFSLGTRNAMLDSFGHSQPQLIEDLGFRNGEIQVSEIDILNNVQRVQQRQQLSPSSKLDNFNKITGKGVAENSKYTEITRQISPYHFDIDMETGTGKTYCYIKTMFELHKVYGWSKFIVVVPSIAIREGVFKTLEITAEHFHQEYGKKAKFFMYNSQQLHNIENFSSNAGINIMVINVQAFNARGKDNRRIYEELDEFQSRRPIDVIKLNKPILILDEPQKMEGTSTLESLQEFNALFVLRYSATHKTQHNKIYRVDAIDAYNQRLVKKISVRGISVKNFTGGHAYMYLESIEISPQSPRAKMEVEIRTQHGITRRVRMLGKGADLFAISGGLEQYKHFVISEISAITGTVEFANGEQISSGEARGNVEENTIRRIQIREAIHAHLEKERVLFLMGIKVLSLFFIDEVAKYRKYSENAEEKGEYAQMFEEEYAAAIEALRQNSQVHSRYRAYIENISKEDTHNGYFSVDKKSKQIINSKIKDRKNRETDDVLAYDLILKDKERLLSFQEPTRFIFSHSALREGWDNPNVFVICTLKHSDNVISRRQEVGRGLRLAVNQHGERYDDPATVHECNVLTVVTNESYTDFVTALQKDISETLSRRAQVADTAYFIGKVLQNESGNIAISEHMARLIYQYLVKNDYVDSFDALTEDYLHARSNNGLAGFPAELEEYSEQIIQLIDSVYTDNQLPHIEDERSTHTNALNENFHKKEFQELWKRINKKAVYAVDFDSKKLIARCIDRIDKTLRQKTIKYLVQRGEQVDRLRAEELETGRGFEVKEGMTESVESSAHSTVKYDLIATISEQVQLTRKSTAAILSGIKNEIFNCYKANPEHFIREISRIIQEEQSGTIIEGLRYNTLTDSFDTDIFTLEQTKIHALSTGNTLKSLKKHIYNFVKTDSKVERELVNEFETRNEVVVYAKLPRGFYIPTPVGKYNPDWAITFDEDLVKYVYFVAESKGSDSDAQLRTIEKNKIECARKYFDKINAKIRNNPVKYGVVKSYDDLLEIVGLKSVKASK